MAKGMKFGNIINVFMLAVFIIVASLFATGIFAQQDSAMNVTGTQYEDSYNSSQGIQESFVSIVPYLGYFLMVIVVILIVRVVRH